MYQNYNNFSRGGDELRVVNGKASAEQFFMYPNSRVLLLDSNCDRFFIKQTDSAGVASIRTYEFKEVEEEPKDQYITRRELEELMKQYELNPKQQMAEQSAANIKF